MTKSRYESMEEPDKRDRRIRNSLGIQQTWAVLPSLCVPWEPDFSIIFSRVMGLRVLRVSSSENQNIEIFDPAHGTIHGIYGSSGRCGISWPQRQRAAHHWPCLVVISPAL